MPEINIIFLSTLKKVSASFNTSSRKFTLYGLSYSNFESTTKSTTHAQARSRSRRIPKVNVFRWLKPQLCLTKATTQRRNHLDPIRRYSRTSSQGIQVFSNQKSNFSHEKSVFSFTDRSGISEEGQTYTQISADKVFSSLRGLRIFTSSKLQLLNARTIYCNFNYGWNNNRDEN